MKNLIRPLRVALAALCIFSTAGGGRALAGTVLPAATDVLEYDGVGATYSYALPGSVSVTVPNSNNSCPVGGCSGFGSASATLSPSVSASASCVNCAIGDFASPYAAFSSLTYSFEITGPASEQVPVIFSYNMAGSGSTLAAAFGTPAWDAGAEFEIYSNSVPSSVYSGFQETFNVGTSGCEDNVNGSVVYPTACSAFNKAGQTELSIMPNAVYFIVLNASISVASDASASVSVDPSIQVDPTFADADLFTVQVSPGIENSIASVPEPGTAGATVLALAALFAIRVTTSSKSSADLMRLLRVDSK